MNRSWLSDCLNPQLIRARSCNDASGPAMLSAVVKHIPTLAFEPNVVPGFANRLVAHFVSGAAVQMRDSAPTPSVHAIDFPSGDQAGALM